MTDTAFAQGVRWNLSELYASADDPGIESDLTSAAEKAVEFEKRYKPLFEKPGSAGDLPLADLIRDYKELARLATKPGVFAHLSFATRTNDPAAGAFLQKIQERETDIFSHTLFFEVKWNRLDAGTAEQLMKSPAVEPDRHFLEKIRAMAPHTLEEGEEKIMAVKSNTSGSAFSRLFDETVNSIPFYIRLNGKTVQKTESEVLSLLHSVKREERKMASESLAEGLKANTRLLTYIYNMILADKRASLKIRHFKHPMDAMNLSNELDMKSVRHLIESVKGAYPLVARYYRLKRRLLGLETFYDYDRYAHLETDDSRIDFEECRRIVVEGYREFSPEAGTIIEPFFAKNWIDAEIREGKQGGGFCCATTPDLHPYILVNYAGNMRDVMTVAHELGHGLHQSLARRAGIFEMHAPLILAETASVFGEMIIFEKLLGRETEPAKRLALICGKIDDNFATVYRQIAMTDFEIHAHEAGLKEGELSADRLDGLWMKTQEEMYQGSVSLTENYGHSWKYIPHFVHTPFYCYAYAFAQLFVLSLYEKYKENKKDFIPKYLEILSLGGSRRPSEIAAMAGLDLENPSFWRKGISLLEDLVRQAEELARPAETG